MIICHPYFLRDAKIRAARQRIARAALAPSEPPEQSLGPHRHDGEIHREDDGVLASGVEEQPPSVSTRPISTPANSAPTMLPNPPNATATQAMSAKMKPTSGKM